MEPMLLPWMLNNRKRHGSLELTEIPLAKKPKTSPPTKPQFRLISFCSRDLAEMCRLVLVYANIPYEDISIYDIKEFIKFKTEHEKFGPVDFPILEWNGKMVHGNDAIGRMLAKMYGLAGMGIFEQAQADSILGIVQNLSRDIIEYTKGAFGVHQIDTKKVYKEIFEPGVKKYFQMFEKCASQGPQDGFFFSSGVTYADFAVANMFQLVAILHPELLIEYNNVKRISQRVFALPQLQAYLASRPTIPEIMEKTRVLKHNFEMEKKLRKGITCNQDSGKHCCTNSPFV